MPRSILTLNAGSSSLRFASFGVPIDAERRTAGVIERIGSGLAAWRWQSPETMAAEPLAVADHGEALALVLDRLERGGTAWPPDAVGVRIVHGGPAYRQACRATPEMLLHLTAIQSWDRDHLPQQLAILARLTANWPSVPVVACFDTAFHHGMPPVARRLAIPRALQRHGVERYGFHGLSYTYLLDAVATRFGATTARGRLILAHLGAGASLAAVHDGRPIDTTMGFTPTGGVMMATRPGDLDPGLLLHVIRTTGMSAEATDDLINRESGLLGVSGISADMRRLLELEATHVEAADAIALFCHQVRKAIGAMAAVLGGVDVLVFSGGIGANSPDIRRRCAERLDHLGVRVDAERNRAPDPRISPDQPGCSVLAMATDEEVVLARQTAAVLGWTDDAPGGAG